ncbi:tail fiber domain-containing protein [Sunxiuqinia elliptica]|uniref:tail fiber domain-containing protein n=1 Tax=Sunxiuqinia elliptica TaxID=655355 RepID=UPI0021D52153|nr:tail fiber domain-containing protein [Sunxiuqinia elliptica]
MTARFTKARQRGVLLTSDERFKDNVKPLGKKLDKLKKLKGVSYKYKNKDRVPYNTNSNLSEKEQADIDLMGNMKKEDRTRIGFLAQDVGSLFPELVEEDKAGNKYVDYVGLIPVLVESVKEQQEQIDELLKLAAKKGLITNKN